MDPRTLDRLDAIHARLYRWRWWVRLIVAIGVVFWLYRVVPARMNSLPVHPANPTGAPTEPATPSPCQ